MEDVLKSIGVAVVIIAIILFFAILFAFPTMWLWNWLMPLIFGLTRITVWQALGLNLLTGIFFRTSVLRTPKE